MNRTNKNIKPTIKTRRTWDHDGNDAARDPAEPARRRATVMTGRRVHRKA